MVESVGLGKRRAEVAVLVSPTLWKENRDDATDIALEEALNRFEAKGVLLPDTMTVQEWAPGAWDNTSPDFNLPNNRNALILFSGEVITSCG